MKRAWNLKTKNNIPPLPGDATTDLRRESCIMKAVTSSARPVILFDGVCHLCSGFVRFVLARDRHRRFDFAPLQSGYGRAVLGGANWNSVVLIEDGRRYVAEAAVIRILAQLTQPWPWLARVLRLFPTALLSLGYGLVARYRYTVFGRSDVCALPQPEWKGRFLS